MTRVYGVIKSAVWEPGSELRNATVGGQWAYFMLISQPQINNLGVLPATPKRWTRLASGLTEHKLGVAIAELVALRFVVVDGEAHELLVRSFIKHNKIWAQPKLVTNARRLIREVESAEIRGILIRRHAWLVTQESAEEIRNYEQERDTPSDRGIDTPSDTPSDTPTRARALRAHAYLEQGTGNQDDLRPPSDAQRLVAEFVYGCKQAGIQAPKRLIGQVAQETGKLIQEGIHPDRIRDGYRRMVQRGIVQPSLLPNFVSEASIPVEARAANGAGMTPRQIIEMTKETP